tara:strand:- start:10 stop:447 length:438 start_codon:yes stop_codon:yes gene_type:complete
MGYLNLGVRIGDGATLTPYRVDFDNYINLISCDNVSTIDTVFFGNTMIVKILYTPLSIIADGTSDLAMASKVIAYSAPSNRPDFQLSASEFKNVFWSAISSSAGLSGVINGPIVYSGTSGQNPDTFSIPVPISIGTSEYTKVTSS